jgi:hypothetical protein
MYFPRNWEFGSALSKLRNFGGGGGFGTPPNHPNGKPLTELKRVFRVSHRLLSATFLTVRRTQRDAILKHIGLHVQHPLFLSHVHET